MTTQNSFEVSMTFKHTEGGLVRLIGVLERRGFGIDSINMPYQKEADLHEITFIITPVDNTRDIGTLKRQIERLEDIKHVSAKPYFDETDENLATIA